jgi:hypothetical protein
VLRPTIPDNSFNNGKYRAPPMTPRDYTVMVGETFYENYSCCSFQQSYKNVMDSTWPECNSIEEFATLPIWIQEECKNTHKLLEYYQSSYSTAYDNIFKHIQEQGNKINSHLGGNYGRLNGAMISRIGQDLYFGTTSYDQDTTEFRQIIAQEFPNTRNIVNLCQGQSGRGWKTFDGTRNRFILVDNLLDNSYKKLRETYYTYHRLGLDVFSQNIDNGRAEIADCIPILQKVAKDKPNSMLLNVFFTAKADELVNIFGKAIPSEKAKVTQALSEIDPTNNSKYQQILKSN